MHLRDVMIYTDKYCSPFSYICPNISKISLQAKLLNIWKLMQFFFSNAVLFGQIFLNYLHIQTCQIVEKYYSHFHKCMSNISKAFSQTKFINIYKYCSPFFINICQIFLKYWQRITKCYKPLLCFRNIWQTFMKKGPQYFYKYLDFFLVEGCVY